LKNLSEECIKFKRKQRNNRYYVNKKLKEKENNIPTDNQNVKNDQNYNFFDKSNEKNNIYFENEIINDEVSVLDCSTNDIESNLNNSDSSISNNSNDFDESDECIIEEKEYLYNGSDIKLKEFSLSILGLKYKNINISCLNQH
jgi:hypothetical protein